jgi:competence protein ComEC
MTTNAPITNPRLLILDVGHGNCSILTDGQDTIIIDCPRGVVPIRTLQSFGISAIHTILLSHADSDHIAGISTILESYVSSIGSIYYNPDSTRGHRVGWSRMLEDFQDLADAQETHVINTLNTSMPGVISLSNTNVEVISPTIAFSSRGVGSVQRTLHGAPQPPAVINSNSLSGVFRIMHQAHPIALIPGDLDEIGLDDIITRNRQDHLRADILIFPHHGGGTGGNDRQFAEKLCSLVNPRTVIFSMARHASGNSVVNPVREIVKGVRAALPNAHIICTQLSLNCSADRLSNFTHLTNLPSQGNQRGIDNRCGGSIAIRLNGQNTSYEPFTPHQDAVSRDVSNRLCKIT